MEMQKDPASCMKVCFIRDWAKSCNKQPALDMQAHRDTGSRICGSKEERRTHNVNPLTIQVGAITDTHIGQCPFQLFLKALALKDS
jgi:hypothetical protein